MDKKQISEVNKYEIHWQIVRASVKGKQATLDQKIEKVHKYFTDHKTKEAWARSVNWVKGLLLGYKAAGDIEAMDKVSEAFDLFGDSDNLPAEQYSIATQIEGTLDYSFEERYILYKDLFKYEKNFTSRRYRHNDLEKLVDLLYDAFRTKGELEKISAKYGYDEIMKFRVDSKNGTSKQKFFF